MCLYYLVSVIFLKYHIFEFKIRLICSFLFIKSPRERANGVDLVLFFIILVKEKYIKEWLKIFYIKLMQNNSIELM